MRLSFWIAWTEIKWQYALTFSRIEVAQVLLQAGADPYQEDYSGR